MTSTTGAVPPRAAVSFALWGTAVLDGRTSLDEAAAVIGAGRMHRVTDVSGEPGPATIPVALGRLRAAGARWFEVALPVPGDPLGLCGPRTFTEAATAAGQAVVVPDLRLALVPATDRGDLGSPVQWRIWPDLPEPPIPDSVAAAGRALREAVLDAADALAELDVAPSPGAEPRLEHPHLATPPGFDQRAHDLLDRADRVLTAVQAALADPVVTSSAKLDGHRRTALIPVERAARRALVAACHPALAVLRRP